MVLEGGGGQRTMTFRNMVFFYLTTCVNPLCIISVEFIMDIFAVLAVMAGQLLVMGEQWRYIGMS